MPEPSGWGPLATEPGHTLLPPLAQAVAVEPTKAPRKRKGRTLSEIMANHKRADGKRGFTFRDLCPVMHIAGESLRAALVDPGRLSVTSVAALAELMGEDPILLLSDILAETKAVARTKKRTEDSPRGVKPKAAEKARSGKPKQLAAAEPTAQQAGKAKKPDRTTSKKKSGK